MRSSRITCSSSLLLWALWSLTLPETVEFKQGPLCYSRPPSASPVLRPHHTPGPSLRSCHQFSPRTLSYLPGGLQMRAEEHPRSPGWGPGAPPLPSVCPPRSPPSEMSHEFSAGRSPGRRWECSHSCRDEAGKEGGRRPGTSPAAGCPLEEKGACQMWEDQELPPDEWRGQPQRGPDPS